MSNNLKLVLINTSIQDNIKIICHIKKNNLPYSLNVVYNNNKINTDQFEQISKNNTEDVLCLFRNSDICIDYNPLTDNYDNLLYLINNNIPCLTLKKYIDFKSNILFEDLNDLLLILSKLNKNNYVRLLEIKNKDEYNLRYKIDYVENINYEIIKNKEKKDNYVNLFIICIDKDENYRLCDYISSLRNNLNLKFLNKLYLLKPKNTDITYIPNCILNNHNIKIVNIKDISFKTVINYINSVDDNNVNGLLHMDIYLNNNDAYDNFINKILHDETVIYSLSRIETDGNKYWEHAKLKHFHYAISQDAWFFNGCLDIDDIDENINVGQLWNELIFNDYLIDQGFEINNCGKSLPLLHLDTYSRNNKKYIDPIRIKNEDIDLSDYSKKLVADQLSIKETSIEDLIKELRMNNDQIYKLKNYLLNKYINI